MTITKSVLTGGASVAMLMTFSAGAQESSNEVRRVTIPVHRSYVILEAKH